MMTYQATDAKLLPTVPGKLDGNVSAYFYTMLSLMALGAGGARGALPALGADQFNPKDPKGAKGLASYFNWLLFSVVCGSAFGVTVIVGIATNKNNKDWWKGFLISTIGSFVGFVILAAGKPFYRIEVPRGSPLVRVAQVSIPSFKLEMIFFNHGQKNLAITLITRVYFYLYGILRL